ncbi:tetratricopeptide repeat protein [Dactylosporangium sp. NPDC051541]|uniref:tetratricopeptide repeat protein n=1 Tax=Dactylosporangium sp. NPDC051541 TaxID=3363977 RepID=UPI0037B3D6EC
MNAWEQRVTEAWAAIDEYDGREAEFRARIDSLAAELPDGDPIAAFERACAWDSTGHSDRAVPLYRQALDDGLTGYRRRRAVIQMSSSLRNIGELDQAIKHLEAERAIDPETLDELTRGLGDAISAVQALCLTDAGREREAVSIAVAALAPHLPRYQRSMANYARQLTEHRG